MAARAEADKLKEAMKAKDDDIGFLRGHVAQLTQSIGQFACSREMGRDPKIGWSFGTRLWIAIL
jgi:hypothetical protein